jgi:hypothetical protein
MLIHFPSFWQNPSVNTAMTSKNKQESPKDSSKGVKSPTDLGQDFIDSGMRLITQQSADRYLSDLEHGGEGGSQTNMPN